MQCDEEHPNCQNCLQSGLNCDFPPSSTEGASPVTGASRSRAQHHPHMPDCSEHVSPRYTIQPSPSDSSDTATFGITLSDLELTHHYSTVTCLTLGRTPEAGRVWQHYAPRLGLSHIFLLRGLLSFAALHLSHLKPLDRAYYRKQALVHHDQALQEFHTVLATIIETNIDAAFLFASLLVTYTFGSKDLDTPETSSEDALDGIGNSLFLVRCTGAILVPFRESLYTGELRALLKERQGYEYLSDGITLPEFSALATACTNAGSGSDTVAAAAYVSAIEQLQAVFAKVQATASSEGRPDIGLVMIWLVNVPEQYVTLLKMRKPEALIILAYFATILCHRNGMYTSD
jgi:hypothetical protein